jgi:hypothetical protein
MLEEEGSIASVGRRLGVAPNTAVNHINARPDFQARVDATRFYFRPDQATRAGRRPLVVAEVAAQRSVPAAVVGIAPRVRLLDEHIPIEPLLGAPNSLGRERHATRPDVLERFAVATRLGEQLA